MRLSIEDRGETLNHSLRDRLARTARLRCADHDPPAAALTIQSHGNGFDSRWSTCCPALDQKAAEMMKERS